MVGDRGNTDHMGFIDSLISSFRLLQALRDGFVSSGMLIGGLGAINRPGCC